MHNLITPQSYTILIVDDDVHITEVIQLFLQNKGYLVVTAGTGVSALQHLRTQTIHCMVLDLMLPDMTGLEVCEQTRKMSDLPILMLTAKGERDDKIQGLQYGADDYLVKPFDPYELIARVGSLLRRTYIMPKQTTLKPVITYDTLQIDTVEMTVKIRNALVYLTPREFQLLVTFTKHPNRVFHRQHLLDVVWGEDYFGEDRVVDVMVTRLRNKLATDHERWKIETIRGIGYKFKVDAL